MKTKRFEKLFLESRYLEVAQVLEQQLRTQPENVKSLLKLGFAYEQQAHIHEHGARKRSYFLRAAKVFERLAKLGHRADAYRGLGTIELHRGNFMAAKRLFLRAYRLDPSNAETLVAIGNALRHAGHPDQALSWYAKYRKRAGTGWQIRANQALTAREAGRTVMARNRARAALRHWPKVKSAYLANMQKMLKDITNN